jgi:HPt (histidine-containing phosphotransfer) domain-containing protein
LIDNINTVTEQPTPMAGNVIAESQSNKLERLIANLIQSVEKSKEEIRQSREDNKRENNATRELLLKEIERNRVEINALKQSMWEITINLEQKLESEFKNLKGNFKALNEEMDGQVQSLTHVVENIQSETDKAVSEMQRSCNAF